MNTVQQFYRQYKQTIFPTTQSHVVCAIFNDEVALPSHLAKMQTSLASLGLNPVISHYNVPVNKALPGNGTVIAIAKDGAVKVYVEDRLVSS